jgi:hypothetical protein
MSNDDKLLGSVAMSVNCFLIFELISSKNQKAISINDKKKG